MFHVQLKCRCTYKNKGIVYLWIDTNSGMCNHQLGYQLLRLNSERKCLDIMNISWKYNCIISPWHITSGGYFHDKLPLHTFEGVHVFNFELLSPLETPLHKRLYVVVVFWIEMVYMFSWIGMAYLLKGEASDPGQHIHSLRGSKTTTKLLHRGRAFIQTKHIKLLID